MEGRLAGKMDAQETKIARATEELKSLRRRVEEGEDGLDARIGLVLGSAVDQAVEKAVSSRLGGGPFPALSGDPSTPGLPAPPTPLGQCSAASSAFPTFAAVASSGQAPANPPMLGNLKESDRKRIIGRVGDL